MKTKIITLIALLIAGGLNMYAQDKKILVAYFSWSGNTQYVAEQIAKQTGGTLFRIEPVKPYPTEYTPCTEVAKKEKEDNARPAIKNKVEVWDSYDTVFIGCPVWWWTAPMIINTFTESYDFKGKTLIPFSSHGGSGWSGTVDDIAGMEPNATMVDGYSISRNSVAGSADGIREWLGRIGMSEQ